MAEGAEWYALMDSLDIQRPRVVFAQAMLETGYFTSKVYKENNNLFGMKESRRKWDIGTKNGHANYPSKAHSILDFREWQIAHSNNRKFKDDEEYIYFLGHLWKDRNGEWVRYAEDPKYEEKLRTIIKNFFPDV